MAARSTQSVNSASSNGSRSRSSTNRSTHVSSDSAQSSVRKHSSSVWTASSKVSEAQIGGTREILRTLGEELYVPDEKLIDMATALSASGPAYVYLFIESLIDAGVYLGMARDMARQLVLQTVLGSTQMVKESGRHPAELKDMVTSPGGTTIEALRVFEDGGFRASVFQAVKAAYDRSKALGKQS